MKRPNFLILLLILPLVIGALLYTNSVRLPFFSDDIPTQRYLTQATFADIWSKVDMNGTYYRPFANLFYKYITVHAPSSHLLMVWAHLLNSALIGALARQLRLKPSGVFFSMCVYAVFPFHAQAVLWIGAGFHLLLTLLVLLACIGALRSLHDRRWLPLTIIAGGLAPFAHETGVVTAALILLVFWARLGGSKMWQKRLHIVASLMPILLAAVLYWGLRSQLVPSSAFTFDIERLLFNSAFFAQGYSLPVQVIASLLTGDAVLRAWVAALAFALIATPLVWRRRRLALVLLHPNYIRYGERLITVAVPAIAILFGVMVERGRKSLRLVAGAVFIGGCVVFASDYVVLHHLHGDYYRQLFTQVGKYDRDTPMLIVNMPSQSERPYSPLLLARANVGLLTDWLQLRDFLWLNMDGREYTQFEYAHVPEWEVNLPDLPTQFYGNDVALADLPALYQMQDTLWQTVVREGRWMPQVLGQRGTTTTAKDGTLFADAIRLENATANLEGNQVQVELFWRYENAPDVPYTAFVHLLCDGQVIAQADGDPFNNTYPFALWSEGEAWMEVRQLTIPPNTNATCLEVNIGLYNRDTLERAEGEVKISVVMRS